jgi:hypothetical protein
LREYGHIDCGGASPTWSGCAFWDDPDVNSLNNPDVNSGEYVSYTFRAFSRLYDRTGGELRLKRSEEVYRSPSYAGPHKTVLVIWEIAPGDLDE